MGNYNQKKIFCQSIESCIFGLKKKVKIRTTKVVHKRFGCT